MQTTGLPESIVKNFRKWNCFIVWSKDKSRLRQIFGYYNRYNHFSIFKSTWATNFLGARFIWTELDRPTPPKSATKLGCVVRRLKKNVKNDAKYKVKLNYNLSILVTSIRAEYLALKQMSIDNNFPLAI
jgi:hypothetical protein